PDRVFFACGACHILAYAFLERYGKPSMKAIWIKPDRGFTGNHIFVRGEEWVFDYHGYTRTNDFLEHTVRRAQQYWRGWRFGLVELPTDVLISTQRSRKFEGLWLREPGQFLHDALPRARAFPERFPPPPVQDLSRVVSKQADQRGSRPLAWLRTR
ncbi:MAG: hypothetical protein KTR19_10870, partial [Hyphomicrobiales bacterium]|nr:hypothetical protein [Hyphomicrobiales bacterium]